jgi:outer membrane protein assembly factor BamB
MRAWAVLTACGLGVAGGALAADNWPHFRGPKYDGISPDKGLQTKFEKAPPSVWAEAPKLGPAFSTFAIVGDKAYTCGEAEDQQVVFCLNADTGKIVWQTPFEKHYPEGSGGDGPRSTPTVDGKRVYVQGAWGKLVCLDAETGKPVWDRTFGAKPTWGYSASVLIEGNLAIVVAGADAGALVGLNKETGEPVWKAGEGNPSYSTPYPFTFEGKRYVVGFLAKTIIIVEPATGREVWSHPWQTDNDVNAASPIFSDGFLFFSSGYGHGACVVKLAPDGDKLKGEQVWEGKAIRAKFQSAVLYEGYLYISDEVALQCVDFKTGKPAWTEKGIKDSTLTLADGQLIVLTEGGKLVIAPASPKAFEPTTRVDVLEGRSWTVPVPCNGRLYLRNLKQAACLQLKS